MKIDRHHAIRLAVAKLRGNNRAEMIDYLLHHPERIPAPGRAAVGTTFPASRKPDTQHMDAWAKPTQRG